MPQGGHIARDRSRRFVRMAGCGADRGAEPKKRMGLLKHLLFWPVTGPMFLTEFSMNKVMGVVREELTDDHRIKVELLELQMALELEEIDDDEYVRREAILMRQLREVREWRERFGMGVSGGPVRVQGTVSEDEPAATDPAAPPEEATKPELEDRVPQVAKPGEVEIDFHFGFE